MQDGISPGIVLFARIIAPAALSFLTSVASSFGVWTQQILPKSSLGPISARSGEEFSVDLIAPKTGFRVPYHNAPYAVGISLVSA